MRNNFLSQMRCLIIGGMASILLLLNPNSSRAQEGSWESAIETVETSAKAYHDYAVSILDSGWIGPANNSIKYSQHQCAILGRMLGHEVAIEPLERIEYPVLDRSSDPFAMLEFSLTLENWVAAARDAVEMDSFQRIRVWNLECIGDMGIPSSLFIDNEQPNAVFSTEQNTLFVYGDIEAGFFERFKVALSDNPNIEEIALGSGGGSVQDALLAGYEIRRLGLTTTLYGNCYSACPLVFMGGIKRILWASPHRLGFHQIYRGSGVAVPPDDPIYSLTEQYLSDMGVNSYVVILWMFSTTPDEMFEPEVRQLCDPGVATFVQRICGF